MRVEGRPTYEGTVAMAMKLWRSSQVPDILQQIALRRDQDRFHVETLEQSGFIDRHLVWSLVCNNSGRYECPAHPLQQPSQTA
ncbi:hypothetical protein Mal52_31650 [Symmachiella dynata]|uniref:Uncharacterized protein n=1 Tax=Symmachiella dynata TaxID=2527995 RepID=A0A517ZQB9_9PLAN|nr:hypothetical protein Mal52_31650 [Symmachiella dynata]